MNKNHIFKTVLFLFSGFVYGAAPTAPTELSTNYASNPLGIDTPKAVFGWVVNDADRGEVQSAFELLVASSRNDCEVGKGVVWNSGKVTSPAQNDIRYEGPALAGKSRYWWKIRTWDKDDQPGDWSTPVTFETAFLNQSDWKAVWIGGNYERFRTEFLLPERRTISSARAYCSAKTIFNLTINGRRTGGDRVMEPGESVMNKRMRYCTYDVAEFLRSGTNAIGVEVGRGRLGHWWLAAEDRAFILQLEIRYTDGSNTIIADLSKSGILKGNHPQV